MRSPFCSCRCVQYCTFPRTTKIDPLIIINNYYLQIFLPQGLLWILEVIIFIFDSDFSHKCISHFSHFFTSQHI